MVLPRKRGGGCEVRGICPELSKDCPLLSRLRPLTCRTVGAMNSTSIEHIDVLIIGAGISGIGAAYYLQTMQPGKTFAILEARREIGGTWGLLRYPGIPSDPHPPPFSYQFKAWGDHQAIAT